jgi:hypothetical protein
VRLHGVVRDSAGSALVATEIRHVVADSIVSLFRTSDSGRFTVTLPPADAGRLQVRRLGYLRRDIALSTGHDSTDTLRIVLAQTPAALAGIDVSADQEEIGGWLKEFYERRRRNSFGRFFTRDDLRIAGKQHISEMLRQTPGVTLAPSRRFGSVVRMRGCRDAPMIWLDGTRLPGAELDDVAKPEDIAGMEIYPSPAGVPAQYLDRSNRGCGTILIWTRHQ